MLAGARVVMVGTTHPGNLGAAARAMGVMGLGRLSLARPEADHLAPEAVARAAGHGKVLDEAQVHANLKAAIASCACAYAFTARRRDMDPVMIDPRACAAQAAAELARGNQVALVFGPEHSGLTNAETDLCDTLVRIPTAASRGSLNVASAIQIACYELRGALAANAPAAQAAGGDLASKEEIAHLLEHASAVLAANYPVDHPGLHAKMLRRLTRLVSHARPQAADVRMLRGMLSYVAKATGKGGQS